MHTQLDLFRNRIDETIEDVAEIKDFVTKVGRGVTAGTLAVERAQKIGKSVEKADKSFETMGYALTALEFVSPIKTPIKLLNDQVKRMDKSVEALNNRFVELDGSDDISTLVVEGRGETLAKLETNLRQASVAVAVVKDALTFTDWRLDTAAEAVDNFKGALEVALRQGETWTGKFDALNASIEAQFAERNAVNDQVAAFYDGIPGGVGLNGRFTNFVGTLETVDFEKILEKLVGFADVLKLFDVLSKPLELAGNLIDPIAPLLNAVSGLVSLIVDPVIDYVVETLGIKALITKAEEFIDGLVPPLDLLDELRDKLQLVLDTVLDFVTNALGTFDYLDLIENTFFGTFVGDALSGPTGWGDALSNLLLGDAGDDILDGLGGRDTINGGGGNDILLAGKGSDTLDGGTGDDMFYFDASFTEYEFSREPDTDNIFVSHLKPSNNGINTGVDLLRDIEDGDHVVFTDISFTGEELKNALIGPSILEGTNGDDLMFLNSNLVDDDGNPAVLVDINGNEVDALDSNGNPVSLDGLFFVANGYKGDDRIFGSTQDDQLNGHKGDDILIPGEGDDQVNGDQGSDTFQVLEGANDNLQVDLTQGTASGQGRDTLTSIENLILAPNKEHQVKASDDANAIYTGDEEDVISALGGDDTVDGGGSTDSIIAGAGADVIYGGGGNDVLVSGSVAVAGIVDTYYGGSGDRDVVSYTGSANEIREISQSDTPNTNTLFTSYINEYQSGGPVKIIAEESIVERYDLNGNRVTTDVAYEVEGFMGSDRADTITGAVDVEYLYGAGGNDTIRTNGSEDIHGGEGDDLIFAQRVQGGPSTLQIEGGGGFDRLDLDQVGDARWYYEINTGISLKLRAHSVNFEGESLNGAGGGLLTIKPKSIEQIRLGNFADHVVYEPGGGSTFFMYMLDGDDRYDAEGGFSDVHAGKGDDIGNFDGGGGGIFRGQRGNDYAIFDDTNRDNQALMGFDDDFLMIERFFGYAEGNDGYDVIAFDVGFSSRLVIDLQEGTAESFKGVSTNNANQVGMTLSGFEEIITGNFNDFINGSVGDEQIIARGGNDTINGQGGRDKLFGGSGNDYLTGGGDVDLIHGGTGNDFINGGTGRDTASFDWVRPEGQEGELVAGQFGSSSISLIDGIATGQFGTDTLASIENVIGSGGNDFIQGNNGDNLLSGGDGNDSIFGENGDDVLVTGTGADFISGGEGDDIVVVGLGTKELFGGFGTDTLDFGTVDGVVTIDLLDGSYVGTFIDMTPRWQRRDLDGDGVEESNGYEVRFFGGVGMTPQQVLEANPLFSNSADDTTRVLPEEDDDAYDDFLIEEIEVEVAASGIFNGFEQIVGGESGSDVIITSGLDNFDGRISDRDVIDLANFAGNAIYNFQTGATNVGLLTGDTLTDFEGMRGGMMDDALTGDARDNFLFGSDGKDVLKGSSGDDELNGDDGDDFLRGGGDDDVAHGGRDDDKVYGDAGDDMLFGDSGEDELVGDEGRDTLNGGSGNDTLRPGEGVDRIFGGKGVDVITYSQAVEIYLAYGIATSQGETDTFNTIENATGSKYDDRVSGDENDNQLIGGFGNDTLSSKGGNDTLKGGNGQDRLKGADGAEALNGDKGEDTITGNAGNDSIRGGGGDDRMYGNGDDDRIYGDFGDDTLDGGKGNDTLEGGAGTDQLIGGRGNDVLRGGDDLDFLYGDNGNDTLDGGEGSDRLTGGAQADTFVLRTGGGFDRINDFEDGVDKVDISDFGIADIDELLTLSEDLANGGYINFGGGDQLFFVGVFEAAFTSDDFIFS